MFITLYYRKQGACKDFRLPACCTAAFAGRPLVAVHPFLSSFQFTLTDRYSNI